MDKNKIFLITLLPILFILAGCMTPEKVKENATTMKPMDLCNELNIATEANDQRNRTIYLDTISLRQINCQTYKNELAIFAGQRELKTRIGP